MGGGKVIECNTKGEWDQHINSGKTVRLVLCNTGDWPEILRLECGPCQMIGPIFVKLSDVDQNAAVAQECGISAMPTFQVFQNGAKVDEMVGAQKDKLTALVEKWAKA
ncbi:thioredoxin [Scenedesmus sp. NREL 46B-D3]|nr:thioredoxin [Scenedesmus sp. NREL 46B-D3]